MTPCSRDLARVALLAVFGTTACAGEIGDDNAPGPRRNEPPGPASGAASSAGGAPAPAPAGQGGSTPAAAPAGLMPLRRLTRREYTNTVRDLLGLDGEHGRDFPTEGSGDAGFSSAGLIQTLDIERVIEVSERLSGLAVRARLSSLLACRPTTPQEEPACLDKFVEQFAPRAFRRPLLTEEVTDLRQLYAEVRAQRFSFDEAVQALIEALLEGPQFLYRWELGPRPATASKGLIRLTAHEVASRLSYFLWSTMPDPALFEAAATGKLETARDVEAQARRMLASPRAGATVESFQKQWLSVEEVSDLVKDPQAFPGFTAELRQAMDAEVTTFAREMLLAGDGRVDTMLGASHSYINEPLAGLYGVAGVKGPALRRVELNGERRFGVLTQAAFLATTAKLTDPSLILRGKFVRERLLCHDVPPPPPDGMLEPPPRDPRLTTREYFLQQHGKPGCAACHRLFDPIGFAFETYDAIGRHRTQDAGRPIDTSGTVHDIDGADVQFRTAFELASILRNSPQVRRCIANQWFRFAFGRRETDADQVSLAVAFDAFASAGFNVREFLVALAASPTFLNRLAAPGEVVR